MSWPSDSLNFVCVLCIQKQTQYFKKEDKLLPLCPKFRTAVSNLGPEITLLLFFGWHPELLRCYNINSKPLKGGNKPPLIQISILSWGWERSPYFFPQTEGPTHPHLESSKAPSALRFSHDSDIAALSLPFSHIAFRHLFGDSWTYTSALPGRAYLRA